MKKLYAFGLLFGSLASTAFAQDDMDMRQALYRALVGTGENSYSSVLTGKQAEQISQITHSQAPVFVSVKKVMAYQGLYCGRLQLTLDQKGADIGNGKQTEPLHMVESMNLCADGTIPKGYRSADPSISVETIGK